MTETSDIWTGEASMYDRTRPTPPPALLDLLTQLIHTPYPALVVDLGSGTGLSTAIWGERAQQVIGIEPNADMRTQAIQKIEQHPYAAHIDLSRRESLIALACLMDVLILLLVLNRCTGWNRLRPWPRSHVSCALVVFSLRTTMTGRRHSIGSLSGYIRRLMNASMSFSMSVDLHKTSKDGRRIRISTACVKVLTSASHAKCFFIISSKETLHVSWR